MKTNSTNPLGRLITCNKLRNIDRVRMKHLSKQKINFPEKSFFSTPQVSGEVKGNVFLYNRQGAHISYFVLFHLTGLLANIAHQKETLTR